MKKKRPIEVKPNNLLRLVEQRLQSRRQGKYSNNDQQALDIPEDCLYNIVLRLPLESILTSRFVCKSWYKVINSPHFKNLHLTHSEPGLIFLSPIARSNSSQDPEPKVNFSVEAKSMGLDMPLLDSVPPLYHIKFLEIKNGKSVTREYNSTCIGRIKAAGNCLILLENRAKKGGGGCLILMNPVTRELKNIPLGTVSYEGVESYGLAFSKELQIYKLVHLFFVSGFIGCEVMDIRQGSWREVDGPQNIHRRMLGLGSPIFAMGALHWSHPPFMSNNGHLVSMTLNDEKFRTIPFADGIRISNGIFEMGGLVWCMSREEAHWVSVWALRGLDGERWERMYSICAEGVGYMVPLYCGGGVNGKFVFRSKDQVLYACDRRSGDMEKIGKIWEWRNYFPHVNGLVSWRN
ncbi:F-box family protein [Striga asiatica]|uniref:F-box family protein n=1 Tax=Striga asiatica TaxID=4170 RepID=A0A5A7P4A1_STRAF|nr:F-box family protein [Striga asiatica]